MTQNSGWHSTGQGIQQNPQLRTPGAINIVGCGVVCGGSNETVLTTIREFDADRSEVLLSFSARRKVCGFRVVHCKDLLSFVGCPQGVSFTSSSRSGVGICSGLQ
jgi:hypothetical protein